MKKLFPLALFLLSLIPGQAAPLTWQEFTYHYTDANRQKVPVSGQTAKLLVPEDHAKPDGPSLELFLMRLPATTPTPGAPIVYLHGGPGGSSLEHLELPEFRALFAALRTQGDVILLDQRGCGKSAPSLIPAGVAKIGPDSLATRENLLAYFTQASVQVRDRLVQSGHDPRNFTITQSAEDIESLRLALGVSRLDLLGHSFGTQLAQTYLRAHPAAVAHAVLAGSRGMDTARKLPLEADEFLPLVAALAKADPVVGVQFPDLMATLRRVLAKADAAPIAVPIEDQKKNVITYRVGGYALRFIIAKFYLKDPDSTRYLPKLLDEIDQGRRPWSLTFNVLQFLRSPVSLAWFTTDAASGVTPARAELIRTQSAVALLGDAMNFPFPEINQVWHMADLGDAFRAPVRSEVPTLFVAGTLDGITPVAQTRDIMRGFTQGRLLTVENGGHNSVFLGEGVPAAIAGFYAGRTPVETATVPLFQFRPLVASAQ